MSLYTENPKAYYHEWYMKNRAAKLAERAEWQKKHRKKCRTYTRNWRARHPERNRDQQRASRLWRFFRITPKEYDSILSFQGGVCAITKKSPKTRKLAVDHCHETGEIRGLLSPGANRGLKYFNHDPILLRAAADYLERPIVPLALGKRVFGVIGRARYKKKMIYGPPECKVKRR